MLSGEQWLNEVEAAPPRSSMVDVQQSSDGMMERRRRPRNIVPALLWPERRSFSPLRRFNALLPLSSASRSSSTSSRSSSSSCVSSSYLLFVSYRSSHLAASSGRMILTHSPLSLGVFFSRHLAFRGARVLRIRCSGKLRLSFSLAMDVFLS
ncbi:hypothetical protein EX30DRAFT_344843 [Ascodesmis nigricans]|uniref:Uncharacterized protein n=1 Tax=Ascodesmis nigricans TaxID=341454 RepID=A0A4V3SHK0_9PEZI|nr:hypothetical protein EX30DRAFT_344843 [Ascodesmis nigricans]